MTHAVKYGVKVIALASLAWSVRISSANVHLVWYPENTIEYTLLNNEQMYVSIAQIGWGPNWAWFTFDGTAVVTNNRRYVDVTRTIGGTSKQIRMQHECWMEGSNQVVMRFRVSVPEDATLTMYGLGIQGLKPLYKNGVALAIGANGATNTVGLPVTEIGTLSTNAVRLILRDGGGTNTIFDITPARRIFMDNQLRLELVPERIYAASPLETTVRVTTVVHLKEYYRLEAESWVRSETNGWFEYPVGPQGVPIDLSFLNKDKQGRYVRAGSHGFLTVSNGAFVFTDGTPARFWGVNCTAGAALGGTNRAAQLAARLARLGINAVRLHHLDSWYNPIINYNHPDGTTQHLSGPAMTNLDAMIYYLKEHGIYTVLDPWVQRCFKAADGVADYGALGVLGNFHLHPWVYMDRRMQELIAKTWSQIWHHVNVFTGVAYKDEPAIVLTEVINEGLMQRGANHVSREPWVSIFTNWYGVWARANGYPSNIGMRIITENFGEGNLRFYVHVHRSFYNTMLSNFHRLGLRIPINANNWSLWQWEALAQSGYDFMDAHHYYGGDQIGPGSGLGGLWVSHPPDVPDTPFGKIALHATPGSALISSECGNNPPKTYRSAYMVGLAAVAALQEWDGIFGYAYSQSTTPWSSLDLFEWEADPASIASLAAGALIYRRGDVRPALETVAFYYPGDSLWQLYWENDGERHLPNTRGFNVHLERHKVVVVLSNALPPGLHVATNFSDYQSFVYSYPRTEVTSDTGELWRDWRLGVGSINTPRTQAVYGYLGGLTQLLRTANCAFTISTRFATVVVSSLTGEPLSNSLRWIVIAAARAENYGQAANRGMTRITQGGTAPVMCEPVEGVIEVRNMAVGGTMYPIRVDGSRGAGVQLVVSNSTVIIPLNRRHRTLFYEVELIPEPKVWGVCAAMWIARRRCRRGRS
ncbi:MAG: hypothetical protein N2595_06425 [bacterium]|nr:hypothetical protein [bacterium]